VLGLCPALSLLPLSFFALSIGTLVTSQSTNVNHTWQLITLILLAQLLVYVWHAWKDRPQLLRPRQQTQRSVIYASTIVFAASYVVCGLVKLTSSGGLWIWKTPLLAVQLMKTNWAEYYDTLTPIPSWLVPFAQWMTDNPMLTRLFFAGGMFVELLGFVVLISRRWALIGGLAIGSFHLMVSVLMQLDFQYHIAAALIFCVNLPGLGKALRNEP
jgi:membrane protein implicated in regulation of membrane protease activity